MTAIPATLQRALERRCGIRVLSSERLGGGMINSAVRIETSTGPAFLKWNDTAPYNMLAQEAHGLNSLRSAATLRVPEVIAFDDPEGTELEEEDPPPPFLVLEHIVSRPPINARVFAEDFGRKLALLHLHRGESGEFGRSENNFIGLLPQLNSWIRTWPDFYRERRILPQMEKARELKRLPRHREGLILRVCELLPKLLDELESVPSLLHGDLWSGNYLSAGDEPVVLDPAPYYGEREMEIAFMQLFGGFPPQLFKAYEEVYPLQPGFEYRRPLHQLYPLLVHLNHFGEPYGKEIDSICHEYIEEHQ